MSDPNFSSRVAALLGGVGDVAVAEALLEELKVRSAAAQEEQQAAEAEALDPSTADARAVELNTKAQGLGFEAQRCARSADAVEARLSQLRDDEREQRQAAEWEAARKERDELAADLAREYPRLVSKLASLFDRMTTNDVLLRNVGGPRLDSAEAVARGFHPDIGQNAWSLGPQTRLPAFGNDKQLAWPRPWRMPTPTYAPPPVAEQDAPAARWPVDTTPSRIPLAS